MLATDSFKKILRDNKDLSNRLDDIVKQMTIKSLRINEDVYDLASKFPYPYECVYNIYNSNGYDIDKTEEELKKMLRKGRW